MSTNTDDLLKVAQAEDLQNLLDHIAWTDVTKPKLLKLIDDYSKMLVQHLLGSPLPDGLTKEMLAGKVYGLQEAISLLERILQQGAKALDRLEGHGFHIT